MKSIILKGGLGNQLFQLSLYLYLLKISRSENIFLDKNTGFILDYKYHRKYELGDLPGYLKISSFIFIIFNLIIMILKRINPSILKLFYVDLVDDESIIQKNNLKFLSKKYYQFYEGYFQDFKIVNKVKYELIEIIEPLLNKKNKKNFNELNLRITKQKQSVALCIRFYEETSNPELHADPSKKNKTINQYNKLIKKFEEKLQNPYFFIFVQEENIFTKNLIFNSSYEFITHKKGYIGSWQRLKAQSLCLNHIFNNSTFYYWGAFISEMKNSNKERMIYISDNFLFSKIYNPKWKTF